MLPLSYEYLDDQMKHAGPGLHRTRANLVRTREIYISLLDMVAQYLAFSGPLV